MKKIAIIQARLGSQRLPGKVLRNIEDQPMINLLLQRLSRSKLIDKIIVATTDSETDRELASHVEALGFDVFRGDEQDVLKRYYDAATQEHADIIIRITGDCPLIDHQLVDSVIHHHIGIECDYTSNVDPPSWPDGLDVEVFTYQALQTANALAQEKHDREHVTPYIRVSNQFRKANIASEQDYSEWRWTVDEEADLEVIKSIYSHFKPRTDFSWQDVVALQKNHPNLFSPNANITRNAGMNMGTGQKLWKRAKQVIPGGNMLLSKRPEMFLPENWPAYFSRAKGCELWDLDGRKFIDMSIMGIGTNVLGYGHPEVDDEVARVVKDGNMSTLNCPEEVYLAEKLISMHPWSNQIRFARTGGEANAIAIRIARAATGKDQVAVCGYHGWHDWYLSANLGDSDELAGHLLPGLDPKGVPRHLRGSVHTFSYNSYSQLEELVAKHPIGAVKMEVCRNNPPDDDFLQKVRKLATDRGIILIFDECTSGFRETFGGLHLKYSVDPDIAVFGKTLGNGYAITAVLGRKEFMSAAQSTFMSSTFWTERIGPTAALKTLEVMEQQNSWSTITKIGEKITSRWHSLGKDYGLSVSTNGIPALTSFSIESPNWLSYKTLITQEMLKHGFLAANSIYTCIAHTDEVVDEYFDKLKTVFAVISDCETGRSVESLLEGPVCHSGFKRLN